MMTATRELRDCGIAGLRDLEPRRELRISDCEFRICELFLGFEISFFFAISVLPDEIFQLFKKPLLRFRNSKSRNPKSHLFQFRNLAFPQFRNSLLSLIQREPAFPIEGV